MTVHSSAWQAERTEHDTLSPPKKVLFVKSCLERFCLKPQSHRPRQGRKKCAFPERMASTCKTLLAITRWNWLQRGMCFCTKNFFAIASVAKRLLQSPKVGMKDTDLSAVTSIESLWHRIHKWLKLCSSYMTLEVHTVLQPRLQQRF